MLFRVRHKLLLVFAGQGFPGPCLPLQGLQSQQGRAPGRAFDGFGDIHLFLKDIRQQLHPKTGAGKAAAGMNLPDGPGGSFQGPADLVNIEQDAFQYRPAEMRLAMMDADAKEDTPGSSIPTAAATSKSGMNGLFVVKESGFGLSWPVLHLRHRRF